MMNPSCVAAAHTETLILSAPVAQALASALTHYAARSKQLEALKKHLFEGQPYNSNQQWFGVRLRSPLILEEQETQLLHALLRDVAETGERAQALLAHLENQHPASNNG